MGITGDPDETLNSLDVRVAQVLNTGAQPLFIQYLNTAINNPAFMDALFTLNGTSGPNADAKAGVMIRETTVAGSTYVMMMTTPAKGLKFQ